MSEANVWSRFEFQQLYQSSPLLSPNCFSLKQIPVLNLNCKDSLGFPGYILHKKTFFFLGFNPGPVVRKRVFCFWFPWRKKVCVIVLFVAQVACFAFSKCLHHFSGILVGGPWGPIGNSLGSLPLGFFWGSLFFLGLWEHPKFRGSLFFGTTLEWIFLKVDPVKSIWVFLNFSFGFHGLMLNRTVDKIQNASRQRNFNLIFLLYKFFELLQLLLKFKGQFLFLLTPVLIQLRRVNI